MVLVHALSVFIKQDGFWCCLIDLMESYLPTSNYTVLVQCKHIYKQQQMYVFTVFIKTTDTEDIVAKSTKKTFQWSKILLYKTFHTLQVLII